jgi:hypothetical protein
MATLHQTLGEPQLDWHVATTFPKHEQKPTRRRKTNRAQDGCEPTPRGSAAVLSPRKRGRTLTTCETAQRPALLGRSPLRQDAPASRPCPTANSHRQQTGLSLCSASLRSAHARLATTACASMAGFGQAHSGKALATSVPELERKWRRSTLHPPPAATAWRRAGACQARHDSPCFAG